MDLSEKLKIINTLTRKTKRCMIRRYRFKRGRGMINYTYKPRNQLLSRISKEFSCTKEEAREKLIKISKFLQAYPEYFKGG